MTWQDPMCICGLLMGGNEFRFNVKYPGLAAVALSILRWPSVKGFHLCCLNLIHEHWICHLPVQTSHKISLGQRKQISSWTLEPSDPLRCVEANVLYAMLCRLKDKQKDNTQIKSFGAEPITHRVRLKRTHSSLLASVCILYRTQNNGAFGWSL